MPEAVPHAAEAGSLHRILRALRVMGSSTLLSMLLGILTTKLIAVVAGRDGIAMVGIYRNFAAMIMRTLSLGFGTVIVQRISTARSKEQIREILGAATLLLALQGLAIAAVGALFAHSLAQWLFHTTPTSVQTAGIRVVLLMAFVNLAMQTVIAILNGQTNLRLVATIQLLTAVATFVLIYPLLLLGQVGLAVNVGSGSVVGLAVGAFYVVRLYHPSLGKISLAQRWQALREAVRSSVYLLLYPIVITGSLVLVQSMLNGHYGLKQLGIYNAASTVMESTLLLAMSSVRTYFLPALGQLDDPAGKSRLFRQMQSVLLVATTAAAVGLLFGAPVVVPILFSREFMASAGIVAVFSLSLPGQTFTWCYNTFLLHKADYRLAFFMDLVMAVVLVGGVYLCTQLRLPLWAAAWSYPLAHTASALCYSVGTCRSYGRDLLAPQVAGLALGSLAWIGVCYLGYRSGNIIVQGGLAALSIPILFLFARPMFGTLLRARAGRRAATTPEDGAGEGEG